MTKPIEVLPAMKDRLQQLMLETNTANMRFQLYVQACMDALNLKGDWNFDIRAMHFTKIEKPKGE